MRSHQRGPLSVGAIDWIMGVLRSHHQGGPEENSIDNGTLISVRTRAKK